MKKNTIGKLTAMISLSVIALIFIYSFKPVASNAPVSTSKEAVKSPDQTCPTSTCAEFAGYGDWTVPNYQWAFSGGGINITVAMCNTVTATPSWYSFNRIGTTIHTPSVTRVFTGTAPGGYTFQCTVYPSGAFYVQQTGGGTVGRGVSISGFYLL